MRVLADMIFDDGQYIFSFNASVRRVAARHNGASSMARDLADQYERELESVLGRALSNAEKMHGMWEGVPERAYRLSAADFARVRSASRLIKSLIMAETCIMFVYGVPDKYGRRNARLDYPNGVQGPVMIWGQVDYETAKTRPGFSVDTRGQVWLAESAGFWATYDAANAVSGAVSGARLATHGERVEARQRANGRA